MPKPMSNRITRRREHEEGRLKGQVAQALVRGSTATLLAAMAVGLPAAPAFADSAAPEANMTNWYWSLVAPVVQGNAVPVGAPAPASGVPAGDLGVGYLNNELGDTDKVAAVAFDLSAIPLRSTFTSFQVTVRKDPAAHQATVDVPDISACELLDAFPDGPGPSDLAKAPPDSSASCVKGRYDATLGAAGGYVFDLTSVANDWSGGAPADGIMLRPTDSIDPSRKAFSLSLLGKTGITTTAEYTPPPVPVVPPPVTVPGPVLPPAPPVPGFVTQPSIGAIGPGPVAPVIPVPTTNPAPVSQPSVAAAKYVPGTLTPGTNWWAALLGLLALLGLTSVVLGDPMAPVVVDSRRRRFAAVVSARPAGTTTGQPTRTVSRPRPA
jgi:hypothetical protein